MARARPREVGILTVDGGDGTARAAALVAVQGAGAPLAAGGRAAGIIEAALALFAQRGFDATSVPEIAAAAKVGTGTIYRYFDTKEALGNAAWQAAKRSLALAIAPVFTTAPAPGTPAEQCRARFMGLWKAGGTFARDWPAAFHFLEFHHEPRFLDRQSLRLSEQMMAPIHGWIADAQGKGVIVPLHGEALAALVWGALGGLVRHTVMMNKPLDDRLLEETGAAQWHAVAAPAVPLGTA